MFHILYKESFRYSLWKGVIFKIQLRFVNRKRHVYLLLATTNLSVLEKKSVYLFTLLTEFNAYQSLELDSELGPGKLKIDRRSFENSCNNHSD